MSNYFKVAKTLSKSVKVAHSPMFEGEFGANHELILGCLAEVYRKKYEIYLAYRNFSDRLRGPFREAITQHFAEHSEDERKAAYDVAMKLVGLGCDPQLLEYKIPPCNPDISSIFRCLAQMELDLIGLERHLCDISGDNTAMRVLGENMVLTDTHHLDDLRRMSETFVG